jgi:hypothetical protein
MIPKSVDVIKEIELKFPVETWKINDIYIWPIIRIEMGFIIYFQLSEIIALIMQNFTPQSQMKKHLAC